MTQQQERARFMLRLPGSFKAWLAAEAARNGSSLNSEIVRAIRERMERVAQSAPSGAPN